MQTVIEKRKKSDLRQKGVTELLRIKNFEPQLPYPDDLSNARFGFFWYNDEEIFNDSDDDLDRKAKAFADAGINIVITFSCTHFRWSFTRYWPILTEILHRIVKACHRYGSTLLNTTPQY